MVHAKNRLALISILIAVGCNSSPTTPNAIEISPASVSIAAGGSAQLAVIGGDGQTVTGNVDWSSADTFMVAVDGSGKVTGGYGAGTVEITAIARGVSGTALVAVLGACAVPLPPSGEPAPDVEVQRFDVRFDRGVDARTRARELANSYGFLLESTTQDGFVSRLTPSQAAGVGCAGDIASMTYL